MSARKTLNIQPIALSAVATTNLLNCAVTSLSGPVGFTMNQPYLIITRMRLVNIDTGAGHNFSLFKGATGADVGTTSIIGNDFPLTAAGTAGSVYDWYGNLRLDSTDFLTGGADTANKIILEIEAEIGISG
jgi:hypothetical protein